MGLITLTLAIAPAVAIIWFVYTRDRYEKEPLTLLILAFVYGIFSIVPAIIGSAMGGQYFHVSGNPVMTAIYAFGVVGLSEEFAKFLFLRFILFRRPEFNEPYDGIIYAVMIGMGFATFENLLYVADGGLETAVLRMFTAVPAHAVFGVAMGFWAGLAKFDRKRSKEYLARGLLVAVILHGAYDFFLMQSNVPGLFVLSFVGLYAAIRWSLKAIRQHRELSPFREELDHHTED
jgi:RsiW-degrading membrane proteinase PrsW (M82 family)